MLSRVSDFQSKNLEFKLDLASRDKNIYLFLMTNSKLLTINMLVMKSRNMGKIASHQYIIKILLKQCITQQNFITCSSTNTHFDLSLIYRGVMLRC